MKRFLACARAFALILCALSTFAGAKDGQLDVIWSDVEGGAATLIVTPRGESILIDTGNPGDRDPQRIFKAAQDAGLKKIDHVIITHLHIDHFGGAAELAKLIPIGALWDNGVPATDPDGNKSNTSFLLTIKPYREMSVGRREVIKPGTELPLQQTENGPKVSVRCLAANQKFLERPDAKDFDCAGATTKPRDTSDNANSIVTLVEFGSFQLFIAGDLTWNLEKSLVCPKNLVGEVDVYQVTHHGLDQSNNPLVVRALQPTVTVMSNGTTKGCSAETMATLRSVPSIQAMYQIHRSLREDHATVNTAEDLIANLDKACKAVPIHLSVAADAAHYTLRIPGNKASVKTFATK